MEVQKVNLGGSRYTWIVLDDYFVPVRPILEFIRYLDNTGKSIHTVRTYANHLKLFWDYLQTYNINWSQISLNQISNFVGWLKKPRNTTNIISFNINENSRKESTINCILGTLSSFYDYQNKSGNTDFSLNDSHNVFYARKYKPFLHHAHKQQPTKRRLISIKCYKKPPKTITIKQYKLLVNKCSNLRDQFLIALLFETGMRIGQALALRHEDIVSWDNEIFISPRVNNENQARIKSTAWNLIHVSSDLIKLYGRYMNSLDEDKLSDYVFINLKTRLPLRYSAVRALFLGLTKKVGFKINPHMLRHTHATQLMKSGMEPAFVQKRLGHRSIQTTLDTYTHISSEDMKNAFKCYLKNKDKSQ